MGNVMLVFDVYVIDSRPTNEVSEPESLGMVISGIPHAPIYIDDTPALSVFELRAKTRRLKAQHDIKFIMLIRCSPQAWG